MAEAVLRSHATASSLVDQGQRVTAIEDAAHGSQLRFGHGWALEDRQTDPLPLAVVEPLLLAVDVVVSQRQSLIRRPGMMGRARRRLDPAAGVCRCIVPCCGFLYAPGTWMHDASGSSAA